MFVSPPCNVLFPFCPYNIQFITQDSTKTHSLQETFSYNPGWMNIDSFTIGCQLLQQKSLQVPKGHCAFHPFDNKTQIFITWPYDWPIGCEQKLSKQFLDHIFKGELLDFYFIFFPSWRLEPERFPRECQSNKIDEI